MPKEAITILITYPINTSTNLLTTVTNLNNCLNNSGSISIILSTISFITGPILSNKAIVSLVKKFTREFVISSILEVIVSIIFNKTVIVSFAIQTMLSLSHCNTVLAIFFTDSNIFGIRLFNASMQESINVIIDSGSFKVASLLNIFTKELINSMTIFSI